jgi:hypothetical protein
LAESFQRAARKGGKYAQRARALFYQLLFLDMCIVDSLKFYKGFLLSTSRVMWSSPEVGGADESRGCACGCGEVEIRS